MTQDTSNVVVAISAAIQAIFTIIIAIITWVYVRTTRHLLEIQIDPQISVEFGRFDGNAFHFRITNYAGCVIASIRTGIYLHDTADGKNGHIDVRMWPALRPGGSVTFSAAEVIETVRVRKAKTVLFQLTYQREADRKVYSRTIEYTLSEDTAALSLVRQKKNEDPIEAEMMSSSLAAVQARLNNSV
jgi:hypothetical protein